MAVRIGDIEFTAIQNIRTVESRTTIRHTIPGQSGSGRTDLGREATQLELTGFVSDAETIEAIETLREAQNESRPLAFAAEIAAGVEFADVTIENMALQQMSGYKQRYQFSITVMEYTEPPASAAAATDAVSASISTDADSWAANELAAGELLENPVGIPDALKANPGLLDSLNMDSLSGALSSLKDSLSGGAFGAIMQAISKIDFAKVVDLVQKLKDAGSLSEFLQKMVDEGLSDICEMLGVDPDLVDAIIAVAQGGTDFLDKLKKVIEKGGNVIEAIKDFKLTADFEGLGV